MFVEKLIEFWESAFNIQVPVKTVDGHGDGHYGTSDDDGGAASTAVVLGSEDFLSLLTSSIVCVTKGEPTVIDHLLSWGFQNTLCDFLERAVTTGRRGAPTTAIIRLLHQLVSRVDCVDALPPIPI